MSPAPKVERNMTCRMGCPPEIIKCFLLSVAIVKSMGITERRPMSGAVTS